MAGRFTNDIEKLFGGQYNIITKSLAGTLEMKFYDRLVHSKQVAMLENKIQLFDILKKHFERKQRL